MREESASVEARIRWIASRAGRRSKTRHASMRPDTRASSLFISSIFFVVSFLSLFFFFLSFFLSFHPATPPDREI